MVSISVFLSALPLTSRLPRFLALPKCLLAKKMPLKPGFTYIIYTKVWLEFFIMLQHFKGLSFPTISSVGPNAAVIHYKPQLDTCSELDADCIYLFDSGAQVCPDSLIKFLYYISLVMLRYWLNNFFQYQDGTTDITRTVHFGKPSAHEKACYTAVWCLSLMIHQFLY